MSRDDRIKELLLCADEILEYLKVRFVRRRGHPDDRGAKCYVDGVHMSHERAAEEMYIYAMDVFGLKLPFKRGQLFKQVRSDTKSEIEKPGEPSSDS